jgi:microcystin degradation protein MlrC
MPRIGIASVYHETNTYSPRIADLDSFRAFELERGNALLQRHANTRTVIGGALDAIRGELVPLTSAGAWPSGPASPEVACEILGMLCEDIARAGHLDGILLNLHGAMVAGDHPDMEADVVHAIRKLHPKIPIVAVLDLHGNPSVAFARSCDSIVGYQTYPHVDMWERGKQAADVLETLVAGRRCKNFVAKLPILSPPLTQATGDPPMQSLLKMSRAAEDKHTSIACISLFPGFPYSDVERAGFTIVITADPAEHGVATHVLHELVRAVEERVEEFHVSRPNPAKAVAEALAATQRPVILADVADNIGAGGAGDGTAILDQLLQHKAEDAVVLLADAEVARRAAGAGVGATVSCHVGGKLDRLHGPPVAITGTVQAVSAGTYRAAGTWMTGQEFHMGVTSVVKCEGVYLVVMEYPTPPFHAEQLECVGLDPAEHAIIAVKGAVAWRSAYGDVAQTVIEVDTPGCCPVDPRILPRQTSPIRYIDEFESIGA